MARTGEGYQQTLSQLRRERSAMSAAPFGADLIAVDYFGLPLTLASLQILGDWSCIVLLGAHSTGPFPNTPLFALARQRFLS